MERLGDDELLCIFNKIPKEWRRSFSQVSKQFLKVACSALRRLHISFPDLMFDVIPLSPNISSFRCSKPLLNAHIKLLAHPHPNLTCLLLGLEQEVEPCQFDFDDDGLCAVAKGCRNLYRVVLSGRVNIGNAGVVSLVSSCKILKYLNLEGCSSVTDESLKSIGESSSIRTLVLKGCSITDSGLIHLANGILKNHLLVLDLSGCDRISDYGIIYLKQMVGLIDLNLSKCGVNVTDESLKAIGESSSIRRLILEGCSITDFGLEYLANGDLRDCLRELDLSGCDRISDNGIIYLKPMVGIIRLKLSKCGVNVTDYGIASIVSELPNIEMFDLSWLINVTDISLSVIASKCLELDKIYLRSIDGYCWIDWDEDSGTPFEKRLELQ